METVFFSVVFFLAEESACFLSCSAALSPYGISSVRQINWIVRFSVYVSSMSAPKISVASISISLPKDCGESGIGSSGFGVAMIVVISGLCKSSFKESFSR